MSKIVLSYLVIGISLGGVARADEMARLDLSLPDLPALVDLDISSDKVTRPSTVRELAASIANGFSADGSFYDGVAVEVAPFGLGDVGPSWLQQVRFSIATVSSTKVGATTGKAAAGLRWSYNTYDPEDDKDGLGQCLSDALGAVAVRPGGVLPPAGSKPLNDPTKIAEIDACRSRFKAAHLAQNALEVAAVIDGTTTTELRLQDLGSPHESVWMSASWGYNSFSESRAKQKENPVHAYGFQPTLMGRLDFQDTSTGTVDDLFVGLRVPLIWESFGVFGEYGVTLKDISGKMEKSHVQRFGGGFDLRIANGSWLGVYVGQDVGPGAPGFSFFSNVKFSFGETRKYGP